MDINVEAQMHENKTRMKSNNPWWFLKTIFHCGRLNLLVESIINYYSLLCSKDWNIGVTYLEGFVTRFLFRTGKN